MRESVGDMLLYVISARKKVSWSRFTETIDEALATARDGAVATQDAWRVRSEVADVLDALAHAEVVFDASGDVFATPPTLCLLPTPGTARAVLCGSRSLETLPELKGSAARHDAEVRTVAPGELSPIAIFIEAADAKDLAAVAKDAGLAHTTSPTGPHLACACPRLDDVLRALAWETGFSVNWRSWQFDPASMRFTGALGGTEPRLVRYLDPVRNVLRHRLFAQNRSAWVDPRWGRHAVLAEHGGVLTFDYASRAVSVPAGAPLPRVAARALSLCSGLPFEPSGDWVVYPKVPLAVFDVLSQKLQTTGASL